MSLLSVEHISHTYPTTAGGRPVLDNVSLELEPASVVAVVGESGCGKTTLGRLIAGLVPPARGSVCYEGHDIWGLSRPEFKHYRRSVQLVHQDPYGSLNPGLTVGENLAAGLRYHRVVPRREVATEVARLLKLVGLEHSGTFLQRYPHELSGGQRQRLVIARALALRPKLVVADEAVSMLDVSLRVSLLDLLLSVGAQYRIGYVFISHDFGVVRYFAQGGRIIVLFFGVVVETGSVDEVIAHPRHPYTYLLLEAIPIADPRQARRVRSEAGRVATERMQASPTVDGCVFAHRCPFARDRCRTTRPPLTEVGTGSGHWSACWFPEEVPR